MSAKLDDTTKTAHVVLEGVHRAICENPGQKEAIIQNALQIFGDIREEIERCSSSLGQDAAFQRREVDVIGSQIEQLRMQNDANESDLEIIQGDGHCLFRSIAYGLVNLYNNEDTRPVLLHSLQSKKDALQKTDPVLSGKIERLVELISLGKGERNSQELIYLLRDIASTHNEAHHSYRSEGRDYFKKMRGTNKWGTDAEILAFSELLGVQIGLTSNRKDYVVFGESGPEIDIQYQNNHFNLVKIRNIYRQTVLA